MRVISQVEALRRANAPDKLRFVRTLPTIDAVEVVRGKWLPVSVDPADPYFRCSVCHYGTDTIFDGGDEPFKYCPNCGAKMDAKED